MPISTEEARSLPHVKRSIETLFDAENLAAGLYWPLSKFMCNDDYSAVLRTGRLNSGSPWTIPILFDVEKRITSELRGVDLITISDEAGNEHSVLYVEDIYSFDKESFCKAVYGTDDPRHPGVLRTRRMGDFLIGGRVEILRPTVTQFDGYALNPNETRSLFQERGWKTIVGFQTRNVPHLGHEYLQKSALAFADGLFINPLVGPKKEGDFRDEVILAAYDTLVKNYYPADRIVLAILKTHMRYAGPKEAIFHAIVRRNFGCTHFIVGRDHAGVGGFYPPYAAQAAFDAYPDLGITPLFAGEFFYCYRCGGVANDRTCPHPQSDRLEYSGTTLRKILSENKLPPKELIRPEVAETIMRFRDAFVG